MSTSTDRDDAAHEGETYVRAHYRKKPCAARPHWVVFDTVSQTFVGESARGRLHWTPKPSKAQVFLKRVINAAFKEEIERGTLVPLKVD